MEEVKNRMKNKLNINKLNKCTFQKILYDFCSCINCLLLFMLYKIFKTSKSIVKKGKALYFHFWLIKSCFLNKDKIFNS